MILLFPVQDHEEENECRCQQNAPAADIGFDTGIDSLLQFFIAA